MASSPQTVCAAVTSTGSCDTVAAAANLLQGGTPEGGGTSCTSQWVSVMVHESVVEGAPGMCGSEPVLFNCHRCPQQLAA